jgi:hypothetical protein
LAAQAVSSAAVVRMDENVTHIFGISSATAETRNGGIFGSLAVLHANTVSQRSDD